MGEQRLRDAGVPEAANDAWLLFSEAAGMDRTHFFLEQNEPVSEEQLQTYDRLLRSREQRIPLQQILGTAGFMGMDFLVNEHVLTPRQDTEILTEEAIARCRDGFEVLDLCTGSGCIAISLKKLYQGSLHVTAADLSTEALKVAQENARRLGAEIDFVQGDLFEHLPGSFDLVVSNPPYIPTADIEELMPEVREHEPMTALDGHEDGLYFYRKITAEARQHLHRGGALLFEIGCDQGKAVSALMQEAGFINTEIKKDYGGLDRVVLGQLPV